MPYNSDEIDKSTPLDDELNPLSNPLLAAHLGRWAEVYFTNRPEHRDRAVLDLIRELEGESGGDPAVRHQTPETAAFERSQEAPAVDQIAERAQPNGARCASCGYVNSDAHSYCGMCGIALTGIAGMENPRFARFSEEQISEDTIHSQPYEVEDESQSESLDPAEEERAFANSAASLDDSDLPHFARRREATPSRARLYVGLTLAIVLGGLIFVAKRGTGFFDGQHSPDSKLMPAAPPAADAQAAENLESNTPLPVEKPAGKEPPVQTTAPSQARVDSQTSQALPTKPLIPAQQDTSAATPRQATSAGRIVGGNELAEAQRDLDGNRRDAQEAVPLLWSAVAKGNGPAMVALSDLYLRGDGVAQNCDQARVLLDSAAKKGAKGAGERLRHLQAFGCR